MKILSFNIENGKGKYVIKRERIEESGKFSTQYGLWRAKDSKVYFGSITEEGAFGIDVESNKDKILKFIDNGIREGKVDIYYKYIGATEKEGEGVLMEIIPQMSKSVELDEDNIASFKEMKKFIESN